MSCAIPCRMGSVQWAVDLKNSDATDTISLPTYRLPLPFADAPELFSPPARAQECGWRSTAWNSTDLLEAYRSKLASITLEYGDPSSVARRIHRSTDDRERVGRRMRSLLQSEDGTGCIVSCDASILP